MFNNEYSKLHGTFLNRCTMKQISPSASSFPFYIIYQKYYLFYNTYIPTFHTTNKNLIYYYFYPLTILTSLFVEITSELLNTLTEKVQTYPLSTIGKSQIQHILCSNNQHSIKIKIINH